MLVKHLMYSALLHKGNSRCRMHEAESSGTWSAHVSLSKCVCVYLCVCKGELCVGWEWGTLVSQLLCVSLPTADPRAVNPASIR